MCSSRVSEFFKLTLAPRKLFGINYSGRLIFFWTLHSENPRAHKNKVAPPPPKKSWEHAGLLWHGIRPKAGNGEKYGKQPPARQGQKMAQKWIFEGLFHSFSIFGPFFGHLCPCPAGCCFPFGLPFFPISGLWPFSMPYQPGMIPTQKLKIRPPKKKECYWHRGCRGRKNTHISFFLFFSSASPKVSHKRVFTLIR